MNAIQLRGVRVHNLQNVDVDIPLGKLTVIVGVSGSGKSSLAFDTLYAEGQRRYIESFSAYARQFLDRLQRPEADRIEFIPPAIAIRQGAGQHKGNRATVGTATEVQHYLRLLFARIGELFCPACHTRISSASPADVIQFVSDLSAGTRFQVAFRPEVFEDETAADQIARLRENGFTRLVGLAEAGGDCVSIGEVEPASVEFAIIDRLVSGKADDDRIADSVELAFREGDGKCVLLTPGADDPDARLIDDKPWTVHTFDQQAACNSCGRIFDEIEPRLFSFNSPLGACSECDGQGQTPGIDFSRIVPNPKLTLREGAIAPWTTPAYEHELHELLDLAAEYKVPVDIPFSDLTTDQRNVILNGVPERDFGGLVGFFAWLQRNRYKVGVGVFLSRWRTYKVCEACGGSRLNSTARSVRIGADSNTVTLPELGQLPIDEVLVKLQTLVDNFAAEKTVVAAPILKEVCARLNFLCEAGLHYLTLDRKVRTLAGGESGRVALTSALGSNLVNTLYVLDEPSAGLHPADSEKVIRAIQRLRDHGNTVVVVEHEHSFLHAADHVIEIGPGAGREGGRIIFDGAPKDIQSDQDSITGSWLVEVAAESDLSQPNEESVSASAGTNRVLELTGATFNNLQNVDVRFPLDALVVISGVSGSGKSSLMQHTLYPAMCREYGTSCAIEEQGAYKSLAGAGQLSGVVLVDQSPVGRTARSNPLTYLKVFDDVRKVFARTGEAKLRNFTPSTFSFNSAKGGRCPNCEGAGSVTIDMQFLADISMTCPDCQGQRYRPEVLEAKYRNRSIADVLKMTVDEAFPFFRGQKKIQTKLQCLRDVGLGYVAVGQRANTLSGGESQRMKLAAVLAGVATADAVSGSKTGGTLFLLDEPTTGLHGRDVENLLRCFRTLISIGHSLIVVEHNLHVLRHADHIIDLGPGAGVNGGRIVATGSPAEICSVPESVTGGALQ